MVRGWPGCEGFEGCERGFSWALDSANGHGRAANWGDGQGQGGCLRAITRRSGRDFNQTPAPRTGSHVYMPIRCQFNFDVISTGNRKTYTLRLLS